MHCARSVVVPRMPPPWQLPRRPLTRPQSNRKRPRPTHYQWNPRWALRARATRNNGGGAAGCMGAGATRCQTAADDGAAINAVVESMVKSSWTMTRNARADARRRAPPPP
eukprot:6382595-Pyramimonas_sp.AAC.1